MACRRYAAIKSFVSKNAADVCMESGDTLIVRPLSNSEWPDPMSEMTNMTTVFPGELVSEPISESVSHHPILYIIAVFSCKLINWPSELV